MLWFNHPDRLFHRPRWNGRDFYVGLVLPRPRRTLEYTRYFKPFQPSFPCSVLLSASLVSACSASKAGHRVNGRKLGVHTSQLMASTPSEQEILSALDVIRYGSQRRRPLRSDDSSGLSPSFAEHIYPIERGG
jgi:hypothetical protein